MKRVIQAGLVILSIVLAYLIYDSINSKIELEKEIANRKGVVVENLEQIREAQIAYKSIKGTYAKNFPQLIHFLKNDSLVTIKEDGIIPDSLLEAEGANADARALELGIITRVVTLTPVKEELFQANFDDVVSSLAVIPFSGEKNFTMDASQIEKSGQKIQVFEAYASYKDIYQGLNLKNEGVNLNDVLRVGSLTEATTNGNWD